MRSDALIPPGRAYIERINMEKVRIQKIIADSGRCSRRKAEELISAGVRIYEYSPGFIHGQRQTLLPGR